MTIKAIYGFSRALGPFQELSVPDAVARLQAWGVNAIFGGYNDPDLVQAAHEAGLRVYAEFGCFVGEKWWSAYPESRPITAQGEPLPKQDGYAGVTPAIPAVRQGLWEQLAELASTRALDGIWLDFIRWSSRWESPQPHLYQTSFDAISVSAFLDDTGLALPATWGAQGVSGIPAAELATWILSQHQAAWIDWKCQQITAWVRRAREIVQARAPDCLLGMFSIPWTETDWDGALRRIMGQDLRALADYIDVFSPMVYHKMCGQPVSWIGDITEHAHGLTRKPIWPIIQTMSQPEALSDQEFGAAIDAAQGADGSAGVILFTLKGLLAENKVPTIQARFNSQT